MVTFLNSFFFFFFFFFVLLKTIWDGLPVFTLETMYHVRTEMRQSLGK